MITINVNQQSPVLAVTHQNITLDIESGGIVAPSSDLTLTAGASLSALRAVTLDASGNAVYASNATIADAQVVGVTITSASSGAAVNVKTFGLITDASWSWTKGPVYLGTNGALTQTAPTGGAIVVQVGKAMTATKLLVDIELTITTV